jgi:hypothetical protein
MLKRIVTVVFVGFLVGCARLSSTEHQVVGTWEEVGIDYTSYHVFNPDHSFLLISAYDWDRKPEPVLISKGIWSMDGETIIVRSKGANYHLGSTRTPPPERIERTPIADLAKYWKRHAPVSYKTL